MGNSFPVLLLLMPEKKIAMFNLRKLKQALNWHGFYTLLSSSQKGCFERF